MDKLLILDKLLQDIILLASRSSTEKLNRAFQHFMTNLNIINSLVGC